MRPAARNLALVGAVSLSGVLGGVVLGNFVVRNEQVSGAEELAAYFSQREEASTEDDLAAEVPPRSGPTSYHCDGCDARLHEPAISEPPDYSPLPPYEVMDLVPPPREESPSPTPSKSVPGIDERAAPSPPKSESPRGVPTGQSDPVSTQ